MMYPEGGWFMGWMSIGWLFILVLIVTMALIVLRNAPPGRTAGPGRESPEDLLKRRFAAGEIGDEEYEKKLRELHK